MSSKLSRSFDLKKEQVANMEPEDKLTCYGLVSTNMYNNNFKQNK